jgi:hypothetical protein
MSNMDIMVLNSIKNNSDINLIYNLCCSGSYNPSIDVILYIIENEKINYVNMIVEPDLNNIFEENIMKSIEIFLQKNKNISNKQYDILGLYFESIDCGKFSERISILIMSTKNEKLKKFLGIWIGIDEESDKMIDNVICNLMYPNLDKTKDQFWCTIQ